MVVVARALTLAWRGQRDRKAARRGHGHISRFERQDEIGRQRHVRVARLKKQHIAHREVVDLGQRQPFDIGRGVEDRQV